MSQIIHVAEALVGPDFAPAGPTEIVLEGGRIAALRPALAHTVTEGLALPAPVNAHDHARPLSPTSFGVWGEPLETWLPGLAAVPAVDAGLATRAALARAALGGVAASMIHLTRPMGLVPLEQEACQIADAADAIGLRIALAISMRDRNPLVYGDHGPVLEDIATSDPDAAARLSAALDRPMPSPDAQVAQVEAVARALSGRNIDVQFGPTGPQWCSPELLEAIAMASAKTGRRIHMHLLETRHQRDWADRTHPEGVIAELDRIGLLTPRLSLAHCTWATADELRILAARGVQAVVNTSSNLLLKSGIAPVADMKSAGLAFGLGLDGCAFDEDDDALREMRLLRALHAGTGFETPFDARDALAAACRTGRQVLNLGDGGEIAVGAPADILVLDLNQLDRDAIMPLDPMTLLFARARREAISGLWVGGRQVIAQGALTALGSETLQAELRDAFRAALPSTAAQRASWPATCAAVATWYRERLGCC